MRQSADSEGRLIQQLYVAGNDAVSIMGGSYPAAGSQLGPALTFGYIAARSLAGRSRSRHRREQPLQPQPIERKRARWGPRVNGALPRYAELWCDGAPRRWSRPVDGARMQGDKLPALRSDRCDVRNSRSRQDVRRASAHLQSEIGVGLRRHCRCAEQCWMTRSPGWEVLDRGLRGWR